jgi:hypothetical protein
MLFKQLLICSPLRMLWPIFKEENNHGLNTGPIVNNYVMGVGGAGKLLS